MSSNYRDSISSGSSYYNNQFREDHGAKLGYDKIRRASKSVDTMETRQQRMERRMLNQFQQKHANLPASKVILVAQAGRYLVLACILPPYFMLYEGPKWLVIQAKPLISLMMEKGSEVMFFLMTTMVDIWAGMQRGLAAFKKPKKFITKNIERASQNFLRLKSAFTLRLQEAFKPFRVLSHRIHNYINNFKDRWNGLASAIRTLPWRLHHQVQERFPLWKEAIMEKSLKALQKGWEVVQSCFYIFDKAMTLVFMPPVKMLYRVAIKIYKPAAKAAHTTMAFIWRINQTTVVPALTYLQNALVFPLKKMEKFLVKRVEASSKVIKEGVKLVENSLRTANAKIMHISTALAIPIQKSVLYVYSAIQNRGAFILGKVHSYFKSAYSLTPIVKRVFKTLWDQGKSQAKQKYAHLKKGAVAALKVVVSASFWAFDKLKKAPFYLWDITMRLFMSSLLLIKKIFWTLWMIFTWVKVLVRYTLKNL